MDTKFFFDLEETLITDWHDPVLCNVQKVRAWITANDVKEANIFSWAVWDEADIEVFNRDLKHWLEDSFGFKIIGVVSKGAAIKVVCKHKGLKININDGLDVADVANFFGKHGIFTEWCLAWGRDCTCVLLDDVVPNRTIVDADRNVTIKLVNVTDL